MSKPIRMCIVCRKRYEQQLLLRLQCKDGKIIKYSKIGRSFYVCKECILFAKSKLLKAVAKQCSKSIDVVKDNLEEILING